MQFLIVEKRKAQFTNTASECDGVSSVELHFKNRRSTYHAMVLPGDAEPLQKCIPLKDMDVLIHPLRQELIINSETPISQNEGEVALSGKSFGFGYTTARSSLPAPARLFLSRMMSSASGIKKSAATLCVSISSEKKLLMKPTAIVIASPMVTWR